MRLGVLRGVTTVIQVVNHGWVNWVFQIEIGLMVLRVLLLLLALLRSPQVMRSDGVVVQIHTLHVHVQKHMLRHLVPEVSVVLGGLLSVVWWLQWVTVRVMGFLSLVRRMWVLLALVVRETVLVHPRHQNLLLPSLSWFLPVVQTRMTPGMTKLKVREAVRRIPHVVHPHERVRKRKVLDRPRRLVWWL